VKLDRRDCPDWMHIRQWVYLEQTSPRVLLSVLPDAKHNRERHRAEQTASARIPIHPAGVIPQRFPQKFEVGNKGYLCGVHTVWGISGLLGICPVVRHALYRVAEWTALHDAREGRNRRNAQNARRRRHGA
jgi:hypothetical protein